MQSPARRSRVAAAPTPATPVVVTVPAPLRFTMANGILELQEPAYAIELLKDEQRQRLAAEAEQAALSSIYRLSGEPDETRPFGGLLTRRLDISERTAYELLRTGALRYTCAGRKSYRCSERAVREYLGDLPPAA